MLHSDSNMQTCVIMLSQRIVRDTVKYVHVSICLSVFPGMELVKPLKMPK